MSGQSLSSLNRAALSAKEGYWWINLIGLALSLLIAKMSFGAYATTSAPDNAWICVTCQGLAIVLAILARRGMTGQMPLAGLGAAGGAFGCSWWASHGLALAWSQGGDSANEWMVFFLTALEPAIFLLAEHIREGRQALRTAHERDEAETSAELARIREKDSANWKPRLATSGGVALAITPAAASASEVAPSLPPMPEQAAIVSTNIGYASAREYALALKRNNPAMTQEAIALMVGGKRSTVGKWLRDAA